MSSSRKLPGLNGFPVKRITLEDIGIGDCKITIRYLIGSQRNNLRLEYRSISFDDPKFADHKYAVETFAVALGVFGFLRYASILPQTIDVRKYSKWIHPDLLKFLKRCIPHSWSEHRYQMGKLEYRGPETLVNELELGSLVRWPIWEIRSSQSKKLLVASGSGKDSLLCTRVIEEAEIEYDIITYIHNLYGAAKKQDEVFSGLSKHLNYQGQHIVTIYDEYFPWLEKRLREFGVKEKLRREGIAKPFRTEAGEVFFSSLAFIPVQAANGIELQVYGNEKSADVPNLIDQETSEPIAHQWPKSFYAEELLFDLYDQMFTNINRVSLTKPIHDVKIFKTLFKIAGQLPYDTNSCNIQKPWCGSCEKCAYVFSGFSAFGDHERTVKAFGKDLFKDKKLLPIWRELLGLEGHIAWECVGQPEEVQLYFYKAFKSGIKGNAIDLFAEQILNRANKDINIQGHFADIEYKYSKIFCDHHHMPDWLWKKVFSVFSRYL